MLKQNIVLATSVLAIIGWVYYATFVFPAMQYSMYYQIASVIVIIIFIATIISVSIKNNKFIDIMHLTNVLMAVLMGVQFSKSWVSNPALAGFIFLLVAVSPFIVNFIILGIVKKS